MDFVLINPRKLENYIPELNDVCLGLGYIHANAIRLGLEGIIINGTLNDYSTEDIAYRALIHNPEVIGISCNFYSSVPGTVELVEYLRQQGYSGHICIGGHAANTCKEQLIKSLDINSISLGDGDISFPMLVKSVKGKSDITNVEGFITKDTNGKVSYDKAIVQLPDIRNLPYPTRPGHKDYHVEPDAWQQIDLDKYDVSTTRGCTYKCSYCDIGTFYSHTRRVRDIDDVINEINFIHETKGITRFSFSDDNFLGGTKEGFNRALEFSNKIKSLPYKIKFHMEARVSDIKPELILPLKDAGLYSVNLGVESGSQCMLNRWKKGITVEQSKRAINMAHSLGLVFNVNYILYDMYTTIDELWESYEFIKDTGSYLLSDHFISLYDNSLGVINGTEISNEILEKGLAKPFRLYKATEYESRVISEFSPLYGYDFEHEEMDYFERNQNYWLYKVFPLIDSFKEKSRIAQRDVRTMCLTLFKQSIELAAEYSNDFSELDEIFKMSGFNEMC